MKRNENWNEKVTGGFYTDILNSDRSQCKDAIDARNKYKYRVVHHSITLFFHCWRIKINPSETITIIYGHKRTTHVPRIKIDNYTLNWSNYIKYLGVTIGWRLNFNQYVKNITKKVTGNRGILCPILNKTRLKHIKIYRTY